MRSRSVIAVVASVVVLASCGSGDDATPTSVEITLATSTTSTTEPVFVPSDSIEDQLDADEPDTDQPASTDVETLPDDEPVTTAVAGDDPPTTDPDDLPDDGTGSDPDDGTDDPDVDSSFSLNVDGLGATAFGADPEGTISFVSSFFGDPSADTGWIDPFEIGACSGTEIRQVDWGQLRLEFGDVSSVTEGRPHFYAYTYGVEGSGGSVSPAGLATPEGLTVGSSVRELLEAYPATQLFSADEFFPASFVVNTNLNGRMTGLADDDVVEVIIGGIPCQV